MLPLAANWDVLSWVIGGLIGFIVFTAIIIYCLKIGFLGSLKEDPRRLWPWTIFILADLICLVGFLVNLFKL